MLKCKYSFCTGRGASLLNLLRIEHTVFYVHNIIMDTSIPILPAQSPLAVVGIVPIVVSLSNYKYSASQTSYLLLLCATVLIAKSLLLLLLLLSVSGAPEQAASVSTQAHCCSQPRQRRHSGRLLDTQTHLSLATPLSQAAQFTYQAEQKMQCLSMMLFWSALDENQCIQYMKWIATVGGAHCRWE